LSKGLAFRCKLEKDIIMGIDEIYN